MNSTLSSAITKVAHKLNIPVEQAEAIYKSYWKYIKFQIEALDFSNVDEQKLASMRTNFNIPYIGKLYTNIEKINLINKRAYDKVKKDNPDVQPYLDNGRQI